MSIQLTERAARTAIWRFGVDCEIAMMRADDSISQRAREHYEARAARLSDLAFAYARELHSAKSDARNGIVWFNALTDRGRAVWLAAAGSARACDAWRLFKQQYDADVLHSLFLDAAEHMPQ